MARLYRSLESARFMRLRVVRHRCLVFNRNRITTIAGQECLVMRLQNNFAAFIRLVTIYVPKFNNVRIPIVRCNQVLAMQGPFKSENLVVTKHKLRLLVDSNVKNPDLIIGLACKPIWVKWVKLNAQDVLVGHELVVYPRLPRIAYFEVVFGCCQKIRLGDRKPANCINVIIYAFELKLRVQDGFRVRIADKLTHNLIVNQVKVILCLFVLVEGGIQVPDEKATLIGLVTSFVACGD